MRDPNRIKPFLQKVEEYWNFYPDLRFGQVIYILAEALGRDIFFPEEKEWEDKINLLIDDKKLKLKEWKENQEEKMRIEAGLLYEEFKNGKVVSRTYKL